MPSDLSPASEPFPSHPSSPSNPPPFPLPRCRWRRDYGRAATKAGFVLSAVSPHRAAESKGGSDPPFPLPRPAAPAPSSRAGVGPPLPPVAGPVTGERLSLPGEDDMAHRLPPSGRERAAPRPTRRRRRATAGGGSSAAGVAPTDATARPPRHPFPASSSHTRPRAQYGRQHTGRQKGRPLPLPFDVAIRCCLVHTRHGSWRLSPYPHWTHHCQAPSFVHTSNSAARRATRHPTCPLRDGRPCHRLNGTCCVVPCFFTKTRRRGV